MNDAILHRGPDSGGFHIEPNVGLGHRRLSIIDIESGQQPLYNEDESVVVVYNGEIYNFESLTKTLIDLGHNFRTRCDTEVIVHAWEQWGSECVTRFRGMFAFALWDRNQKTLFLARDRLGVKPLFYASLNDGSVAFSSELKGLKCLRNFSRTLDESAIEEYFAFGYVPDPKTIYQSAFKLEPGHSLTWKLNDREPRIQKYWDAEFDPSIHLPDIAAQNELEDRLKEAVRIRLISEVPLGAFLSGGIDSGTVVALMAGLSNSPVKTCSIGFESRDFDESQFADMVAKRYSTDHSAQILGATDFAKSQAIVANYDEPYADSSAIPTYRVCELARKNVTVALSGDGGDETFGGYRRYSFHLAEERFRRTIPTAIRAHLIGPLGDVFPKLDWMPQMFRAKTTLQAIGRTSVQAYFHSISQIRDVDRSMMFSEQFRRRLNGYNAIEVFEAHARNANTYDPLSLIQYLDYKTYLPGDINTKVDRASMAHSLEVREPLMDHELVEWMAKLPSSQKIRGAQTKMLLKNSARSMLPKEIVDRKKMGFAVPLADWYRTPAGKNMIDAVCDGPAIEAGILDRDRIQQMYRQHTSAEREWSTPLWVASCFDNFMRSEA